MNFKKVMLMSCFLFSLNCFANGGDLVGNGGNVVTCWNSPGDLKSIELLDFYEARTLRGITADLGSANNDLDQAMSILLKRLADKNPTRALRYKEWFSSFFQEAILLPGIELIVIPDSNHIAIPAGCRVEQIVNQRDPEFAEDKRYSINKDLWDKLDNNSKAGLILHELIYREAIKNGVKESTAVRYLNSLIASDRFKSLNPADYLFLEMRLLFPDIDIFGTNIDLCLLSNKNNSCSNGRVRRDGLLVTPDSIFISSFVSNFMINFQNKNIEANGIMMNRSGNITQFTPAEPVKLSTVGGEFLAGSSSIVITDSGIITWANLAEDTKFELTTGQFVICSKDDVVNFDKISGRLIYCKLSAKYEQKLKGDDYDLSCSPSSSIHFTPMGHFLQVKSYEKDICLGKVLINGRWLNSKDVYFNYDDNKLSLEAIRFVKAENFKMPNGQSLHFLGLDFDKLGNITEGRLAQRENYKVRNINLEIQDVVSFSSNGTLLSATINTPEFEWSFADQKLKIGSFYKCSRFSKLQRAKPIEFFSNGEIKAATLVLESVVEFGNGKAKLPAGTEISGLENGKVGNVMEVNCK